MQKEARKTGKKYKALTVPNLSWTKGSLSDTYGELIVGPLEPGFGVTLGNALRRVALSSVEGCAVTAVKIAGVNNEFSVVPGIIEDTLNVILNVKSLIIKNSTGEPGKMYMNVSGKPVATAEDIEVDDHLEILNKDVEIAHLAEDGKLEIEFFVQMGRGYVPAQWDPSDKLNEEGKIFVDAAFSPVKRIEYRVEKTRVGKSIDYDKLIFRVTTNGTVTPQEVITYSSSVLRSQLEHFLMEEEIMFNDLPDTKRFVPERRVGSDDGPLKGLPVELFLKPIDELEFSVRAHNCLVGAGIRRVIDLVNLTEEDILRIKNFGRKSLREVREILDAFGLSFGMNIRELDLKRALKKREEEAGK
jgi:DNA-directed RNA polymerase subunit alpha